MVFDDFRLCDAVRRGVEATGFNKPTPLQDQVLPVALEGHDLLVFAETGTGKTAAYGLPILDRLCRALGVTKPITPRSRMEPPPPRPADATLREGTEPEPPKEEPAAPESPAPSAPARPELYAVILGPNREVVTRAEGSLRTFGGFMPVRIRAIFGGVPAAPQREALRRGLHVVAATPGRLAEILRQQDFSLDKVKVLVLDELDHLVQMNLMKEANLIIERLPKDRQTFVFANKRTPEVEALAREFVREPKVIEMARLEAPLEKIRQVLYPVESVQKSDLLLEILKEQKPGKAVVFFRTRRSVDRLQPMIERLGRRVAVLHADRTPAQRQLALEAFSAGEADTLLATEMAVRSLEVENITHLINFDLPQFPDDYVNRIARCSQLDPVQDVVSLVSVEDRDSLRRLEKHLGRAIERVKLPTFEYVDRGRRSVDRILSPLMAAGESLTGRGGEPGFEARRLRRPLRPLPPIEKRPESAAASESTQAAPPGETAPAPASPAPGPTAPAVAKSQRQFTYPTERLTGRLTRTAPPGEKTPEAETPAAPGAPPPARPRPRPRFSLADEKRSPLNRPHRPTPVRESPPAPPAAVPPPVTAGPPKRKSVPEAPPPPPKEQRPARSLVSFSAPAERAEGKTTPTPPRTPFRSRRMEFQLPESEPAKEPVEEEEEETLESEESAEGSEPAEAPTHARPAGGFRGRGPRQTDRRQRRIRSWDLHRGGILESPPVYSTPYDTFVTEERQARKRDSFRQAVDELATESSADATPILEVTEEGVAPWIPLDWDHPSMRFGRPSRLIREWKRRMAEIQRAEAEAAAAATTAPKTGKARHAAKESPKAATSHPAALPAWPVAADSDTTAATAPGAWWGADQSAPTATVTTRRGRKPDAAKSAREQQAPATPHTTGRPRSRAARTPQRPVTPTKLATPARPSTPSKLAIARKEAKDLAPGATESKVKPDAVDTAKPDAADRRAAPDRPTTRTRLAATKKTPHASSLDAAKTPKVSVRGRKKAPRTQGKGNSSTSSTSSTPSTQSTSSTPSSPSGATARRKSKGTAAE